MFTDFAEIKGHGGITTSGAIMHTLIAGRRFDRTHTAYVEALIRFQARGENR